MIVKQSFGKSIISQHLAAVTEIRNGSEWLSSTGDIVIIDRVDHSTLAIYYYKTSDPSTIFVKCTVPFQLQYNRII